jgi:type II secretory pathway predicted ATPase ExeA
MPYLAHFGLKDSPFTLTPDVDYFFPSHEHSNIIGSIEFALRRDCGIVKVVGEVGTGKTLLCRLLMKKLVENEAVAYINAPQADEQSIIRSICREFGLPHDDEAGNLYAVLNHFLLEQHEQGRLVVIVVDEAQHLGHGGLEALRLVSNLETEKKKLLQIVLFGQTELDELLAHQSLRQLNQRIVFSLNTKPLAPGETKRYVQHRVRVSRRQGVEYPLFTEGALNVIVRRSGGIPRVINILADKALLVAFSCGSPTVLAAHVAEAVKDSPTLVVGHRFSLPQPSKRAWLTAAGVLLLLAVAIGGYALYALGRAQHVVVAQPQPQIVATASPPAAVAPVVVASPPVAVAPVVASPLPAPAPVPVSKPAAVDAPVPVAVAPAVVKPAAKPEPRPAPVPVKAAPVKPAPVVKTPAPAPVVPVVVPAAPAPVVAPAPVAPSAQPPAPTPAPQPAVERVAPADPVAAVGSGVYPGSRP